MQFGKYVLAVCIAVLFGVALFYVFGLGRSNEGVAVDIQHVYYQDTNSAAAKVEIKKEEYLPVRILHLGDMMLGRHVAVLIDRHGFDWLFAPMVSTTPGFFSDADLTVVNLEGPFAEYRIETTKEIAFQFNPDLAPLVADLGIDLVSLANNHSYDMGVAAFAETKQHLASSSIRYIGEQYTVNSSSLYYETIASTTIAFVGINDTHPGTDIDTALTLIEQAEQDADLTIVTIHWGAEYQLLSNARQRMLAHQFIDTGADAVIGHHPHVVQELEVYNGAPIAYSLGNFVFDQYFSTDTQQGLGIEFMIVSSTIDSIEVLPFQTVRSQVTPMEESEKQQFLDALFERSRLGEYTVSSTSSYIEL
jgi:poly-gamma-glutamate synthesis protein (capsule biosynthesis protein)